MFDTQGNEYCLDFNKDAAYMLVGGQPASGKSSLMHTIILQAILRYSHRNLIIYPIDFSDCSEYDCYSEIHSIKYLRNNTSNCDSIPVLFEHINSIIEERWDLFYKLSDISGTPVRNIDSFYKMNDEYRIINYFPRIIFILDGFQLCLEQNYELENRLSSQELFRKILKFGYRVGIHFIVSSPTPINLNNILRICTNSLK